MVTINSHNHPSKSGVLNGTPDKTSGRSVTSSRFQPVAVTQNSCPEYSSEVLAYYFIKKFNHAKSGVLNGTPDKTSGRAVTTSRFQPVAVAQNSCPEYSSEVLAYYFLKSSTTLSQEF